jgi:hypothetical protein
MNYRHGHLRGSAGRFVGQAGVALACALAALFIGCASTRRTTTPLLSHSFTPEDTFALNREDLSRLAVRVESHCSDSTPQRFFLPLPDSAADSTEDDGGFGAFRTTLRHGSCTTFRPRPVTYEVLRALHAASCTAVLLCIDYAPGEKNIVDKKVIESGAVMLRGDLRDRIRMRVVHAVRADGEMTYELVCHDGERVGGLAQERLLGQVYPAETPDGRRTYHQVAGLFCISRQTLPSLEHYLDEWFRLMPYEFERPILESSW